MKQLTLTKNGPEHRALKLVAAVVVAALVLLLPLNYPSYQVFQFCEVLIFSIAVLSLNLLTGYTGQISLGHSFFFAIGAYATAIMIREFDVHFLIPLVVAFAISFIAGFAVGIPALRLTGIYLALVTIALAAITPALITRFDRLTGGSQGIIVDQPSAPGWTGLADDLWSYYICLVVACVMFFVARNLVQGVIGRSMTAVRDNELAARAMGVNPAVPRTLTFAYSAGFAGVAGALYALVVGLVDPGSFTIILAIYLLVGTVVGGMATIAGAVFGGAFITYVPIYTSELDPALGGVFYGVVLIVLMVLMPGGVMGLAHRIRVRFVTVQEPSGTRAGEVDATSFESRPADLAGHRVTTSTSGEDRP